MTSQSIHSRIVTRLHEKITGDAAQDEVKQRYHNQEWVVYGLMESSLKTEAVCTSETLVFTFWSTTRCRNPEDQNTHFLNGHLMTAMISILSPVLLVGAVQYCWNSVEFV
jgi:hypothetical protein